MCDAIKKRKTIELADIFSQYADAYIKDHGVSAAQNKAIKAISRCRTAALGGHIMRCDNCGKEEQSYNSCRYRHCPKCQTTKQLRWLEDRKTELLPVPYFHVVFTLPHELNALASYNPTVIYNVLFKAAWKTIDTLGRDPKRLGGLMGMMAFLHTWGQNLSQHIHLHCMIPGGALYVEALQAKWRATRKGFLFPVKVMSKLFGKKFISLLRQAFTEDKLLFKGSILKLKESLHFEQLLAHLGSKSWNIYAKEPFKGAAGGLEYLARYVSKTALSNDRIISCENGEVRFKWRDYSDHNKEKVLSLKTEEFIRRYLSHVLPDGFMRVRFFGFLANACKAKNINTIRELFSSQDNTANPAVISKDKESIAKLMLRLTGIDIECCKHCKIGHLLVEKTIMKVKPSYTYPDTS